MTKQFMPFPAPVNDELIPLDYDHIVLYISFIYVGLITMRHQFQRGGNYKEQILNGTIYKAIDPKSTVHCHQDAFAKFIKKYSRCRQLQLVLKGIII